MSKKKMEHFSGNINVGKMFRKFIDEYDPYPDLVKGVDWNVYIVKVIYNNPATIVFWNDGTKTVSKCHEEDIYDYRVGLLTAVLKKFGMPKSGKLIEDWAPHSEDGFVKISENSVVSVADVRKRNRK